MKKIIVTFILMLIAWTISSYAQSTIQWRGSNRTGKYYEKNLLQKWPDNGPNVLWCANGIGKGYSSVTTNGKVLFLTSLNDSTEFLVALDFNGNILWKVEYGNAWMYSFPDSRCAPTILNDSIYVTSGTGEIACISAMDGKLFWKIDAAKLYSGVTGVWGYTESLLLYKDKVIFTPGGHYTAMVAVKKRNGNLVWKTESLNDTCAFVSPIIISTKGKDIIVNLTARLAFCVDPNNGRILSTFSEWDVDRPLWHPLAPVINCVTPLYRENQIYLTSGYNHVGIMLNVLNDAKNLEMVWKDTILDNHHGGVVEVDGYIYGSNWKNNANGNWCCIDWKTGKKMWEEKWHTKGSIIYADEMLYLYEERTGNMALVKSNPEKFELVSTFKVTQGTGPHWSHPIIYNGVMYIRHGDSLIAFDIKSKV